MDYKKYDEELNNEILSLCMKFIDLAEKLYKIGKITELERDDIIKVKLEFINKFRS